MKILVCISNVPDTTSKINFKNNDTEFDSSGIQYIINPNDINQIVAKIEKLYCDRDLIPKMSLHSKRIYNSFLKEENLVGNYKKCFDFLMTC